MSDAIDSTLLDEIVERTINGAWLQWRSLGSQVSATGSARYMVDPEALVLISLALRDHERRLRDVLASWAASDAGGLSVQRMKNLAGKFPGRVKGRLAEFALIALEDGGDHRWMRLAGAGPTTRARGKELGAPDRKGWDPAALMVRLRLGMGVGLHADILSFLLALRGEWASVRLVADATGYNAYAIRRTAEKLAEARFIESTGEKPLEYRADPSAWKGALGLTQEVSPWRFWFQAYALVADLMAAAEDDALRAPSSYVLSSRLRDLMEKHQDALRLNRIPAPDASQFKGEAYLEAFGEIMKNMGTWLSEGT